VSSITLKDIPEGLLERLRTEARRQHRSLSKQALLLIASGLDEAGVGPTDEALEQVRRWRELAGRWVSEQTFEEEVADLRAARTTGREVDL
jgi:plasmid stability protein